MTARERLLAAFRCQPTDVLPVNLRGLQAANDQWVAAQHPSYAPVIEAARERCLCYAYWSAPVNGLVTAAERFRTSERSWQDDDWRYTETTLHTPLGPLTSVRRDSTRDLPGMVIEHFVKEPEDVGRVLSVPYEPPRPDCAGFHELDARMGDGGLPVVYRNNPIGHVYDLMGSETLALWSTEPRLRRLILKLLEVFTERLADLARYLLSQGVGPVFGLNGHEYTVPPLHGPADFRAFCTDFERRITEPVLEAGGLWHVHCHGSLKQLLEEFVAIGANCLHPLEAPPMGDVTLAEGKHRLQGRVCIEGNIQIGDIYTAPTSEIIRQTRECIEAAAEGGGFILGVSAGPYTRTLPEQAVRNYLALIETAAEYAG